jgi:hypothetical protein
MPNQINSLMDMFTDIPGGEGTAASPRFWSTGQTQQAPIDMFQSAPALYNNGVFSPPAELAGYFDQFGAPRMDDPRTVAAQSGQSIGQLAQGFFPRGDPGGIQYSVPNDRGGFFSISDLYGLSSNARPEDKGGNVPSIGQYGRDRPSTNNWRLLGMGPGWVLRNGFLINTQAPETKLGFPLGADMMMTPESGMNLARRISIGTGATVGLPGARASNASAGWPGAGGWVPFGDVFGGG